MRMKCKQVVFLIATLIYFSGCSKFSTDATNVNLSVKAQLCGYGLQLSDSEIAVANCSSSKKAIEIYDSDKIQLTKNLPLNSKLTYTAFFLMPENRIGILAKNKNQNYAGYVDVITGQLNLAPLNMAGDYTSAIALDEDHFLVTSGSHLGRLSRQDSASAPPRLDRMFIYSILKNESFVLDTSVARAGAKLLKLKNGNVLIAGGGVKGRANTVIEIYNSRLNSISNEGQIAKNWDVIDLAQVSEDEVIFSADKGLGVFNLANNKFRVLGQKIDCYSRQPKAATRYKRRPYFINIMKSTYVLGQRSPEPATDLCNAVLQFKDYAFLSAGTVDLPDNVDTDQQYFVTYKGQVISHTASGGRLIILDLK